MSRSSSEKDDKVFKLWKKNGNFYFQFFFAHPPFLFLYIPIAYQQHKKQKKVNNSSVPLAITANVIKYLINKTFHKFKFRELYCDFWLGYQRNARYAHGAIARLFGFDWGSLFQFPRKEKAWRNGWEIVSRNNRILIDSNKLVSRTKNIYWFMGPLSPAFNCSSYQLSLFLRSLLAFYACCRRRAGERKTKTHRFYVTRIQHKSQCK